MAEIRDSFDVLMEEIIKEKKQEKEIIIILKKVKQPYKNILFKTYIQAKSLVEVANEMNYAYKYTINMHKESLNEFDKICKL